MEHLTAAAGGLGKAPRGAGWGGASASLEVTIFRHGCSLGLEAIISKRRVYLRVADLSKLLAVEDKTAVRPRATYSLPAEQRLRTGPLCAP